MNTQLLQKCIDSLHEKKPNTQYILGILETLKEMGAQPVVNTGVGSVNVKPQPNVVDIVMTDEEKEYYAKMAGGTIAPMRDGLGE